MDNSAYEAASQYFIHRDFANVLQELGPTGPGPSLPAWVLYLALCERAFVEPDRSDWPLNDPGRKQLRSAIHKSLVWPEMEERWTSIGQPVPHNLVLSAFKLALRHKSNPRPVVTFMEHAMASATMSPEVLAAFIQDILIGLQHDFFYAREMVSQHDELDQPALMAAIAAAEADYEQELVRELNLQKQLEEQRVRDAIASTSPATGEKSQASADESDSTLTDSGKPGDPAKPGDKAKPGDQTQLGNNDSPNTEVAKRRSSLPARPRRTLAGFWKDWFHHFVRSQGLYNALLLLILVLGVASNRRARDLVNRGSSWLWRSLKIGVKMGMSVTYL